MSGYIGTQPVPQATQTRDSFTATSGQTSFATGGYTPNFLDVYLNGVKLASADYTATNGSDVVLASGAATGDILEVVAFTTFTPADLPAGTPSIDDNGNATAMTIDSSERVLIGKSSTAFSTAGHRIDADGNVEHIRDSNPPLHLNRKSSDGDISVFYKDGTGVGSIGVSSDGASFGNATQHVAMHSGKLFPASPTHSTLDNTIDLGYSAGRYKDLYLSGGIYLGGTGSANKLDDYEEGSWTPTLPNGGTVSSINNSNYTKIGNLVTINLYTTFTPTNNASVFEIGGLPFAVSNNNYGGGSISYSPNLDIRLWSAPLFTSSGGSHLYFYTIDGANTSISNNAMSGNATTFILQGTYYTDA